ncbi:O-methyltransferase [Alkalicoccus chagannorensis]|uniref:O-methyltransferase n=1 Tax=Alkalicoccus chagannorensis TaxID=427072 RepID=UPI000687E7EE|nr:O-methyltransferase [Alkalicoccus chagannorensis]
MELYALNENAQIIGPEVGNFLSIMTKMMNASNVLELGSSIGYSTIWFAKALNENGKVIYTDFSSNNAEIARDYFSRSNVENKVYIHVGDALEFTKNNKDIYDIVLIDLEKELYLQAFDSILDQVRQGGLIIADNTMWGGHVRWELEDDKTKTIKKYNKRTSEDERLQTSILPIKDGLTLSIKL